MTSERLLGNTWLRHDEPMPTLFGQTDKIERQIWFKSEPLTQEFCQRVVQIQLCTDSHDQGYANDKSQGSWSWFEIVILPGADTDVPKRTKDGHEMAYQSHGNQLAHENRTMHYGLMFDRRTLLLASLEVGDVLAVRACVRFPGWKNYGYRAAITTRMIKEDLFPTDLWTLDSQKVVQHDAEIMNCAYQYSAPTGCLVRAKDATIYSKIWFATPAFDADMIDRLESLQLCTRAQHQRAEGEEVCGLAEEDTFSWFDIVILESPTDTTPMVVNGVSMVWLSHKNTWNTFNKDATAGQLFDESSIPYVPTVQDVLKEIGLPEDTDVSQLPQEMQDDIMLATSPPDETEDTEDKWQKRSSEIKCIKSALNPGCSIGVRVCAQFAGWEAYAESGYLVVRISDKSRPAPDIVVPDYSASNDQAAEIKRALLAYHDNIVTPDGVHITFESADVTMLDNEVRADEVIQIAPPPYSENAERPLRLLSLDGGGVRGVSELCILKKIMDAMPKVPNTPKPDDEDQSRERSPHPYEVFDMIAGTSTGGLIALMLGRLKMSVKDCEKAYDVVSEAIFGKLAGNAVTRELNSAAISFSAGSYMYAAEPLIEQVQGLVKKHLEGHLEEEKRTGDVMLINEDKDACKVFVVTCRANKTSTGQNVVKLRSYETKASPNEYTFPKIKIWEAARATSAAPAYFERVRLTTEDKEEHQFIDGGMVYNNPAPLVLAEIGKVFGYKRPIGCLLSLGTGVPVNLQFSDGVLPVSDLIALLTNGENAAITSQQQSISFPFPGEDKYMRLNLSKALSDEARANLPKTYIEKRKKILGFIPYWSTEKVEVNQYVEMIKDMDDWKGLARIRELTNEWLKYEGEAISGCVQLLTRSAVKY